MLLRQFHLLWYTSLSSHPSRYANIDKEEGKKPTIVHTPQRILCGGLITITVIVDTHDLHKTCTDVTNKSFSDMYEESNICIFISFFNIQFMVFNLWLFTLFCCFLRRPLLQLMEVCGVPMEGKNLHSQNQVQVVENLSDKSF